MVLLTLHLFPTQSWKGSTPLTAGCYIIHLEISRALVKPRPLSGPAHLYLIAVDFRNLTSGFSGNTVCVRAGSAAAVSVAVAVNAPSTVAVAALPRSEAPSS